MKAPAESILAQYEESISALGFQLCDFLHSSLKDCTETPDFSGNIIHFGYGPGYIDTVCTIIPSKKGIKLGFYRGSELPDPEKLLKGSGKVHRYVEIKSIKDIQDRALKQLMKEATKAWKVRKQTKSSK
jgi:hypothetical protein